MKRLWSSLLTAAALGCLVALWALPAAAYYPTLQATATWGDMGVACEVYDPKLQKQQVSGHAYGGAFVADLKQDHGVIAWIVETLPMPGANPSYFVNFCVYDPAKAKFMEESLGPYKSVSFFTVKDGTVAYVVPSTNFPGWDLAIYATYDPTAGWMKNSWESINMKITTLLNKDGMVVFLMQVPNEPYFCGLYAINYITFDIYDPKLAKWAVDYYSFDIINVAGITNPYIANATFYYGAYSGGCPNPTNYAGMVGYRPDYQDPSQDPWSSSLPTTPLPWFWAQSDPLWVWFTDMSIGGSLWRWDFGDGASSFERSTYHVYPHAGRFAVTLDINGGAGGVTVTKPVTVGWGPHAIMLLLTD